MNDKVDVLAVMDFASSRWAHVKAVELVEARAAVADALNTLRMSAEALESAANCIGGDLAIVLRDRAMFARAALARVQGGAK